MATSQQFIDRLLEAGALAGDVTARKMCGEYGLFCDGKMFAIVGEDMLFIKTTEAGRATFLDASEIAPYPGAKPALFVPESKWAEREWLAELMSVTVQNLPPPKPKRPAKGPKS
jgi:DNA transformation protein